MEQESAALAAFDEWAIVDVMGHQRYVGRVTEQVVAGRGFVRIDVPETPKGAGWTKLIGTSSIYAISPVTEAIARAMAAERNDAPVSAYDLPRLDGPADRGPVMERKTVRGFNPDVDDEEGDHY